MSDRQFETMFSFDGWIVGWVLQRSDGHTRITQDPHIRVTLGALLQVRSDATDMMAVVRVDPHDRHWTVQMRSYVVDPKPRGGGGGGGGGSIDRTRCAVCNSQLVCCQILACFIDESSAPIPTYPTPVLSVPPYCPVCTHD